jgi:hypothetical protein
MSRIDEVADRVEIWLSHYSPEAAAMIVGRFGEVVDVSPESATPIAGSGRFNDSEPWYGGDSVERDLGNNNYGICTAWFNVLDVTANYGTMMTAGHCGSGEWYNGPHVGQNAYDRGYISDAARRWVDNGVEDAERSTNTGTQTSQVWADPTYGYRNVHSVMHNPTAGTEVCIDGQTHLETCGAYIRILHGCITYTTDGTTKTECDQYYVKATADACGHGDSGGPVYTVPVNNTTNGDVAAIGMFIAFNDQTECWVTPVDDVMNGYADTLRIKTS